MDASPTLLSFPGGDTPLSIRAKAAVFADQTSRALLQQLERIAPSTMPVLVIGETGTGKELIARHIHQLSGRKGPFVAVNCGAISEQLAESELFGHEAGAFTGAVARREGWFEAAHHGTLFLDEIGDLPLPLQVKLLRVLQEGEVVRVGARKPIPVDVRLLAATNVDLGDAVAAGHFRLDLLYRLNIAQLQLPPLRERRGDILPLVDYFIGRYSQRLQLAQPQLSDDAAQALLGYAWPGNIRELENVVHFALLVASGGEIRAEHLKLAGAPTRTVAPSGVEVHATPLVAMGQQLRALFAAGQPGLYNELERLILNEAYRHSGYNQVRAAALLGISRNVLRTLLKRHGMLRDSEPAWRGDAVAA
ncbi:sigma-54 interaction domain-containing protein [Jeongeupia naejangsanensis]|uniref:Sigma 54-interacting transcriptional regulator n=1 Tax=Jeongeupia naejangsanensis TaxID=613195 RepID=A0ABS2BN35_9NEIS|nr:sigma 54-interacting transcriptional regulator [Jeongeupia naejangsanensis]MBM3117003.1 sigma 54-interacting transcriptional regulator [Jeongeupia naejangsanensis]